MKPPPKDWPRMCSGIYCRNAAQMIDWYCKAFGFAVRLKVEGDQGRIEHSELTYGGAMIMVGEERAGPAQRFQMDAVSPLTAQANTQSLMVFVDDADEHCRQARAAGARIVDEPKVHDYGQDYWADRSYGALDPEGHLWWFTQRVRDPAP
jgi:uncharacterized glyoxalase superfamily protein PhnB